MEKTLVINADDFGMSETVNAAVEQAHTEGVLTSTTIMANMPAAAEAIEIAKKLPNLGVGVHLNLSDGPALSSEPCMKVLTDSEGRFCMSPAKLAMRSVVPYEIKEAIETELAAQIQWVIDNAITPTHLDSHKHIHCFAIIFSIVCQLARRFKISAIRNCFEPARVSRMPWPLPSEGGKIKAQQIRAMAAVNKFQNTDFSKTDALLGVAHSGKIDVNFFKAVALYNGASVSEVMTHPEKTEEPSSGRTELDALCSEKTKQYLKEGEVRLVHYGQLWEKI